MSVATRNPFALLNDDDVGESTPTPAPAPASAPAPSAAVKDQKEQKAKSGPASRGGRYYQRGGGAKNAPRDPQDNDAEATPRENRKAEGEFRGRGRGGRGGRGRGGPGSGRGRQFDRRSGTLPDSDKKVNQGWGANKGNAELNAEQQGVADAARDATTDNWAAAPAATAADNSWGASTGGGGGGGGDDWAAGTGDVTQTKDAAAEATSPTNGARRTNKDEEEDHSLTLDEYLAKKAKDEVNAIPKIESVRKANEGIDESLWKDAVPISKDDDSYFVGKSKAVPKARARKEEKIHIEIDAHFERPARGSGRGGRGRGGSDRGVRGGRGRGGARQGDGAFSPTSARDVDVDDQAAFPSLS